MITKTIDFAEDCTFKLQKNNNKNKIKNKLQTRFPEKLHKTQTSKL